MKIEISAVRSKQKHWLIVGPISLAILPMLSALQQNNCFGF